MIDFTLTEEQEAVRKGAREFADRWLAPNAIAHDREKEFAPGVVREAARLGFYGLNVPQEHGGLGLDTISMSLAAAEIGRSCGSLGLSLGAHTVLPCEHIRRRGTAEQKARWLPKLASGEWLGAWGLTEPGGGSDVLAIKTTAAREGDGWVINGEKCFITNGSRADLVVVTARTPEGFGAFVVRKGTPGFEGRRSHDLACMRASDTASLRFDGCRVGAEAVLGDGKNALRDSFACLDLERVLFSAVLTEVAREALRKSVEYGRQRHAFGRPIYKFQGVYSKLANLSLAIEASDALWLKAAWKRDLGQPFTVEAARAKLAASRLAQHAALDAIQVHAGAGLEVATGLERMLRDSLLGTIGGGTSEIQEMVIARGLGLEIDPNG